MASTEPLQGDSPRWARRWLIAAGLYNLAWGLAVVLAPHALFDFSGIERMRYPEIWQCVGMVVGVYGVGYLIAARDSRTHWPIVLVGLLGKLLGPLGFAVALARGTFPPIFGVTILANDLLWWLPFCMILWDAARSRGESPGGPVPSLDEALGCLRDQRGATLEAICASGPTLVVLTRHSGCTFCREAFADLSREQNAIRARGMGIAIVTMSPHKENERLARAYALEGAAWFSDPDRVAYRALELRRGRFLQLFGPLVFLRGVAATLRGHTVGGVCGDGFQMPGAFVIHNRRVLTAYRHERASDRPDYQAMACQIAP